MDNIRKDSGSPFQICQSYQTLATAIARNPKGPPPLLVSEDCSRITYRGKTLDFPAFQEGVRRLLAATKKDLDDLLSGVAKGRRPCSADFRDVWPKADNGYSWMTTFLEATPADASGVATPLQDALIVALPPNLQFSDTTLPDGMQVAGYLGRCTRLCKNLALLVFLTMGKPPPVHEMVDFLYSNSATKQRNMFARAGHFWFVSRQSPKPGVVGWSEGSTAYKISPLVTDLLMEYFLFVRPAEMRLYCGVHDSAQKRKRAHHLCSTTAWVDSYKMEKLQSEDLSQLVKDFFLQESLHRQAIGPVLYAQLYAGVVLNYCEQQVVKTDANAEQAGHTLRMAQTKYANETDQLPWMPSDKLLQCGRESEKWWKKLLQLDKDETRPPIPLHLKAWKEAEQKMSTIRTLEETKDILCTTASHAVSAKDK